MASNTFDINLVVFKNYNNNNRIYIVPYGCNFRGAVGVGGLAYRD